MRLAALMALGAVAWATVAEAAPKKLTLAPAEETKCGAPPPPGASWFYLGAPGQHPAAKAARRALVALNGAFDEGLPRDPSCLHLEVLDTAALNARYRRLGRGEDPPGIVGFHNRSLGSDSTVFVVPQPGQGLEVVIVHEVLHALSHRFSSEAGRRRVNHMVEGATEFLTRAIAGISLGIAEADFRTGYGLYVQFYAALMKRLGNEGLQILTQAYFADGYHALEQRVDERLGVSLRAAARRLEEDDLRGALQLLR